MQVKHVILCGHTSCGAVAGSLKFPPEAPGTVNLWLADLKETARLNVEQLDAVTGDKEKTDLCDHIASGRAGFGPRSPVSTFSSTLEGNQLSRAVAARSPQQVSVVPSSCVQVRILDGHPVLQTECNR